MSGPLLNAPGFFGKLPTAGDFVSRRLPMGFVAVWDPWVTRHLARRGDFAPLCFVHPETPAGAMTGVILPSRDRAGRRFPLTLAAPGASAPPGWYTALQAAGAAAVAGVLDADALAARLAPLPPAAPGGAPERLLLWLPGGAPEAELRALLAPEETD